MANFKYFFRWFSWTGLLMGLSGCMPTSKQTMVMRTVHERTLALHSQGKKTLPAEKGRTITVWVHGTKGSARMMPITAVKNFFDCKPGLHHWRETACKRHMHKIATLLTEADPVRFAQEDFYLFGWSGLLSFQAREQAASELHSALVELLADYQHMTHDTPAVRIITHSHGGNVALLLPEIMAAKNHYFPIEELIVLACPVQDRTASLVDHVMFKKVYSLYSSGDLFQIGDPQGAYKGIESQSFFSRRHFQPHQRLRQVMIKFNGRALSHIEFILAHFLSLLPVVIDEIDTWYNDMSMFVHEPHGINLVLDIKKK